MITLYLPDPAATDQAGILLGRLAQPGDVIAAQGTLGAGKTALAQGIARGIGVPDDHYVNSPTFAILLTHPGRILFHHLDLYRLGEPDEALGLGLEEVVGTDGLAYIEWPGRYPEILPQDHLRLLLEYDDPGRRLILDPRGPRSEAWVGAFMNERSCELEQLAENK